MFTKLRDTETETASCVEQGARDQPAYSKELQTSDSTGTFFRREFGGEGATANFRVIFSLATRSPTSQSTFLERTILRAVEKGENPKKLPDIPGDPGSQLPYQESPPITWLLSDWDFPFP